MTAADFLARVEALDGKCRSGHDGCLRADAQGPDYCDECEHQYPCPTVAAIESALTEGDSHV